MIYLDVCVQMPLSTCALIIYPAHLSQSENSTETGLGRLKGLNFRLRARARHILLRVCFLMEERKYFCNCSARVYFIGSSYDTEHCTTSSKRPIWLGCTHTKENLTPTHATYSSIILGHHPLPWVKRSSSPASAVLQITSDHFAHPSLSFVRFLSCHSLFVSLICYFCKAKKKNALPRWYTMCEGLQHWPGGIGEETEKLSGIPDEMGTGTPLLYAYYQKDIREQGGDVLWIVYINPLLPYG